MSAHTRGPWRVLPEEVDRAYIRIRGARLGGRYKVANVLTPSHEGVSEREAVETRANARLIAAAPQMLEALCEVRDMETLCRENGEPQIGDGHLAQIDAAIAAATGGQP